MDFDALRAAVVPGAAVVGRWPGVVCVAECADRLVLRRLLDVCASAAGPEPGRTLARRLTMWLGGPDAPGEGLRFGTVAVTGGDARGGASRGGEQWAVFLYGPVGVVVPDRQVALSGAQAVAWTDRLLPRPDVPVVLALEGGPIPPGVVDGVHDLRIGVVPGAGAVLVPGGDGKTEDRGEVAGRVRPEDAPWGDPAEPERRWSPSGGEPAMPVPPDGLFHPVEGPTGGFPRGRLEDLGADRAGVAERSATGGIPGRAHLRPVPSTNGNGHRGRTPWRGASFDLGRPTGGGRRREPDEQVRDTTERAAAAPAEEDTGLDRGLGQGIAGPDRVEVREDADGPESGRADAGVLGLAPGRAPQGGQRGGIGPGFGHEENGAPSTADDVAPVETPAADLPVDGAAADAAEPNGAPANTGATSTGVFDGAALEGGAEPDRSTRNGGDGNGDGNGRVREPMWSDSGEGHWFSTNDDSGTETALSAVSQNGSGQNGASLNGAAQNGAAQNGTAQNGTAQNGAAQNGTGQHDARRPRHGRPEEGGAPKRSEDESAGTPKLGVPRTEAASAEPDSPPTGPAPVRAERIVGAGSDEAAAGLEPAAAGGVATGETPQAAAVDEPQIQGTPCPRGHLNDPRSQVCAQCGTRIEESGGQQVAGPRPPLGLLVFDDGATYSVDAEYLVGRMPEADERVTSGELRSLPLEDGSGAVSRVHAEIRVTGWDVQLVDSGSRNGTFVSGPGDPGWTQLPAGQSHRLVPGTRVRLGGRSFHFDSPSGAR